MLSTLGQTGIVLFTHNMQLWSSKLAISPQRYVLLSALAGALGVALGAPLAMLWRRTYARADPLVCGMSAAVSLLFVVFTFFAAHEDVQYVSGSVRRG